MPRFLTAKLAALALATALAPPAAAQEPRPVSHCIAIAEAAPGIAYIQLASTGAPLPAHTSRITYIDHSMFLLELPGGLEVVTDFNGFIGARPEPPHVVTMNNAHSSHFAAAPDPAIPHVLEGWSRDGAPAGHYLQLGEVILRSVSTDVRAGGRVRENGNSIFVFEAGGLCIGHLGHLHHAPSEAQYAALGRLDVVMAAVDGGLTLDLPTMISVLTRLRASVVIPMHWFGRGTLDRFLAGMAADFEIRLEGARFIEVSLRSLPKRPTVVVLEPGFLPAD